MPATAPVLPTHAAEELARLGERLRRHRKQQGVSAVAAAEAAGMSRVTLHRIERGEPSVTIGAWLAVAQALGLRLDLQDSLAPEATADSPQLKKLEQRIGDLERRLR
jgi:transcriptional regulator with XRE-family HTH domain